ncbi:MAG: hypothetical protein II296_08770 [Bacteroidaceae bacterium]|nr:hypothetical protein [Bacteroidaceae bacterium]
MSDAITFTKAAIIGLLSELLAFFAPIENNFIALVWLFALNFLFGLLADVLRGRDFSMRKAITCITHASLFFALCASLYGIGYFQNVSEEMLNQCVSSFCWILVYCYSTNIVRNIRSVVDKETPAYKALDLVYHTLTMAFVRVLPYIGDIIKQKKEERHGNK